MTGLAIKTIIMMEKIAIILDKKTPLKKTTNKIGGRGVRKS
jgi:hypothetical protein